MFTPSSDAALVLSGADLQALHQAQLALLSPALDSSDDSLHRCGVAISHLLGTPYAAACLRQQRTWRVGASDDAFGSHLPPALASFHAHSTSFTPSGFPHTISVRVQTTFGEGLICAAFAAPSAVLYGSAGQARLELLVPALQARVQQQAPGAASLLTAVEKLGEPLAIYSAGGIALCHSSAFRRRLRDEPEADRIYAEAQRLSALLCTRIDETAGQPREPFGQPRVVRTSRSRYELHGSRIPRHLLTQPAALIHLRATRSRIPSKARLRTRLGLTEREVEVALLVADGLTSKEIAQRLCVSTNTIRRHGEKVLEKLGLHSRAGVAMALMREG